MIHLWVLLVICAGLMASPAMAEGSCIPKELRNSLEDSKKAALENQKAANAEYLKEKAAADALADGPKKVKANSTALVALKRFADAEVKAKAQSDLADPLIKLAVCVQPSGLLNETAPATNSTAQHHNATAQTQAAYTAEFADLRSTLKLNQQLLIFLIFLFIAAIILLYILLSTLAKHINSSLHKYAMRIKETAETQTDSIRNFLTRIPSRSTTETQAAPVSSKTGGQSDKMQLTPQTAESMHPTAGKAAPAQPATPPPSAVSGALMPQRAHHQGGQIDMPPSPGSLISNGNTQHSAAAKAPAAPAFLVGDEDFDWQLNEPEIWPIVLPMAALIVATDKNLTTAVLTQTLMRTVESSRPGLARKMREIGFQAISGRLAPDGRENTRDPEMFAVELSDRTLLFPSPRGKYKQSLDTYFEGASMHNWKNCLRAAVVQKTGDNLLTVIERGICGG